jgi:hypothetical protein
MATGTLSKPSSKYSTDVTYCLQVENNARSALIGLYCRDVGQIGTTVGSHLKEYFYLQFLLRFLVRFFYLVQPRSSQKSLIKILLDWNTIYLGCCDVVCKRSIRSTMLSIHLIKYQQNYFEKLFFVPHATKTGVI